MVIVVLPIALLMIYYFENKNLVFIAFPVAELCGMIISIVMYNHIKKIEL